jgi:hypothetical protein
MFGTVLTASRFHGYALSAGSLELHGEKVDAAGTGMFVHAMQSGMQPNKIASRWNFTFFAGQDAELGSVTAIQMEFTTTDSYGPVVADNQSRRTKVNIGSIYATNAKNGRLTIVGQTHESTTAYPVPNKDVSVATHLSTEKDPETGYLAPHGFRVDWAGDRLDGEGRVVASAEIPDLWSGLIEKVDVLAEIPKILRRFVAAATGADPYIFQYHNPTTVNIEVDGKTAAVKGWMFNEASFISA